MKEHSTREWVEYEADADAEYDEEYVIDLSTLKSTVAFPHLPENTHTIDEIDKDIKIGTSNLLKMSSKVTIKKLEEQIEELQKQSDDIANRINEIEQEIANKELSLSYFDQYINQFASFTQNFNTMTAAEKTLMLRTIIDRIIWDGEKFDIILAGDSIESIAPQGEDSKRNPDALSVS